jgi:hypothetical protein
MTFSIQTLFYNHVDSSQTVAKCMRPFVGLNSILCRTHGGEQGTSKGRPAGSCKREGHPLLFKLKRTFNDQITNKKIQKMCCFII